MAGFDPEKPWNEQLAYWDFNVLDVPTLMKKGSPLEEVGYELIRAHDLVNKLNLSEPRLLNCLRALESKYNNNNPYHCSAHATDVATSVHFLLESGIKRVLSPLEVLALFLASFGHDLGHFALNNAFLTNTKHEIAMKYNFRSSLENFHLQGLLAVLEEEENNFLVTQSKEEVHQFKQLLSDLVLATDMALHRDHLTAFQKWRSKACSKADDANASTSGEEGIECIDSEGRNLVMVMTMKCADLANVVKPLRIADAWAERIMEEFYVQGERETEMSLPLTQFPSRDNSEWRLAKHQLSFLENVVHPLFESFLQVADESSRTIVISHAKHNTAAWTKRVSELAPADAAH